MEDSCSFIVMVVFWIFQQTYDWKLFEEIFLIVLLVTDQYQEYNAVYESLE